MFHIQFYIAIDIPKLNQPTITVRIKTWVTNQIFFIWTKQIRFGLIWERLTELIKISSYWTYIDWLFLLWRFETYRLRLINLANFHGLIMNLEIKIYKIFWPIIGVLNLWFSFINTISYVVVLDYNITCEAYYNIDFFFLNMSHILFQNLHHIPKHNINVLFHDLIFLRKNSMI